VTPVEREEYIGENVPRTRSGNFVNAEYQQAGLCFPAPRRIEPGQAIEVEVTLAGFASDGKDIHISGAGYIVRVESGNIPGWYKLAAAFDEPPGDDKRAWHKLVAELENPTTPETDP
jgi:hypothetical protein